jgi:hypothetical protein
VKKNLQIPSKPQISKSKYELTLSEFPIFILSKKTDEKIDCIEYQDTITGKGGQLVQRDWKVYPDVKLGFGSDSTFKTLFDLFQIWKEQNFENQFIQFGSVYRLLKRRGNNLSKGEYNRIMRDLKCLVGMRIEAKNAFWDNEIKGYVDMTFHLFDHVALYKEKPNGQATLPFARIKASDILYGSVLKNSILIADFDSKFFHGLTPVEQRLALYLAKIFRSQTIHKRDLLTFARQIPIYAKQTKHIKERLKKACDGLLEKEYKYLEKYWFEKTSAEKNELIVFQRKGELPKLPALPASKYPKQDYEIDLLVQDILEICGDSKSELFYRKVADLMPKDLIYRAVAEVREVSKLGQTKRSPGALFTALIKKYATEHGINFSHGQTVRHSRQSADQG